MFFQIRLRQALPAPGTVTLAAFEAQPGFGRGNIRALEEDEFF
jgi:hypothetical protein